MAATLPSDVQLNIVLGEAGTVTDVVVDSVEAIVQNVSTPILLSFDPVKGDTGATGGPGPPGPPGPTAVSGTPGNVATLGSDSLILVQGPVSGNASATQVVKGNDTRLSDSRVPAAHHTSHEHGGSDAVSITYSDLAGIPASFTPIAHGTTHKSGGSDALALDTLAAPTDILTLNVGITAHGLAPKAPNSTAQVLRGDGLFGILAYSSLGSIPSAFTPSAHATTHEAGGSDAVPLDALAAPSDITTLNSSTTAHGLLPKLNNVATNYLTGTGLWGAIAYASLTGVPTSFIPAAHAPTHAHGGSDPVTITYSDLAGIPANFVPSAHAATHKSGGSDSIALDSLGATTDITTLNASPTAHGLLPKLNNVATNYLNGAGGWTTPATGAAAISTDAGNIATLGSDSGILVPQSAIWSARLRSFNAIGNPTFEVDQRNGGASVSNPVSGSFIQDRWTLGRAGSQVTLSGRQAGLVALPGTSFYISQNFLRITLTTAQASLAAGDSLSLMQFVEGPRLRELLGDVHSISLLVRSSVNNLKFGVALRDPPAATKTLTKLCALGAVNTWTLITLPNLPVMTGGNFGVAPGAVGYTLTITLAAGATVTSPANDSFQVGTFVGAVGQDNFAASPVNSTFDIAFCQHEPGALCTTPIDLPFTGPEGNYEACLRYFQKTYDYDVAVGTANAVGQVALPQSALTTAISSGRLHNPMAKIPTYTAYNSITGAVNSVRQIGGTDYAVTGFNNPGKSGFMGINFSATPTLVIGNSVQFHYTADTGW